MSENLNSAGRSKVVYDGEEYSRESLQGLVKQYQDKHGNDLQELEQLRKTHDDIAREMNKDLTEQKTAWEYMRSMISLDPSQVSTNFRGLLEKIPVLNDYVADRPISELLRDKIHVAELRTAQVGQFLDQIEMRINGLRDDVTRLNKKMVVAAHNEEKAAALLLDLRNQMRGLEDELAGIPAEQGAARREKQAAIDELKREIWEHGAQLRLYSNAEDRIASIVSMNNNFLEMLMNLHANMTTLHDSGQEILDELRGNLSGLATATQASELTLDMQTSLASLRTSVNKVASLASQTSLFLTQNVERLTSQMKVYDDATKALVESNLAAEREIMEKRIDETLELAQKEYTLLHQARQGNAEAP
ncbi:MAG: hypothetical protein EB084_25355 [Proteobacteria bacterium]|nr:hypothetical protein [Pseudomonadota bacterium]